jgi:hypothetical protein
VDGPPGRPETAESSNAVDDRGAAGLGGFRVHPRAAAALFVRGLVPSPDPASSDAKAALVAFFAGRGMKVPDDPEILVQEIVRGTWGAGEGNAAESEEQLVRRVADRIAATVPAGVRITLSEADYGRTDI